MEAAVAELAQRIRDAAAASRPLAIRGGGSKGFYGEPLQGEPLDTRGLRGIVSYEPSELVVTARAGMPLAELEAALAEQRQCLPFEPPHFGGAATGAEPLGERLDAGGSAGGSAATVGGMVAAGLSGPARASVGAVRDYVLGLQMLNGRGEHLVFGGQVMKNVAGYDVSRLMAGSLGILGVITEVSLKVLPIAPAEATLKFEMPQDEALRRLNAWGGQPLPLNASCWVEDAGVSTLYLRLRGAEAAVEAACRSLGGERQDNAAVAPDWRLCRDQQLPWFAELGERELWRLSVPQTTPVLDLPEPPLVEWHGGQRWVRVAAGQGERLREIAQGVGGHATLFRAAEGSRAQRLHPLAPPLDRIHRELKREFDPAGVFNRGRMVADL